MSDILSSAVDIYLDEGRARNVYLLTRIIASHNHYRQSYISFALITSADSHAVALRSDEAEREAGFSSAPIYVAAQRDSRLSREVSYRPSKNHWTLERQIPRTEAVVRDSDNEVIETEA
jgi:hypothetical protein